MLWYFSIIISVRQHESRNILPVEYTSYNKQQRDLMETRVCLPLTEDTPVYYKEKMALVVFLYYPG